MRYEDDIRRQLPERLVLQAGYASMARYFVNCAGHPLSATAADAARASYELGRKSGVADLGFGFDSP